MAGNEAVRDYHDLSVKVLKAATVNLESELYEPALANAIHSLELSIKAVLLLKIGGPMRTHNVGGLLGKYYRVELGDEMCKEVNRILMVYNVPRYPGIQEPGRESIVQDIEFIRNFVSNTVGSMIAGQ